MRLEPKTNNNPLIIFNSDNDLITSNIENYNINGIFIKNSTIKNSSIMSCTLNGTKNIIENCHIELCTIDGGTYSNCTFKMCKLINCVLNNCTLQEDYHHNRNQLEGYFEIKDKNKFEIISYDKLINKNKDIFNLYHKSQNNSYVNPKYTSYLNNLENELINLNKLNNNSLINLNKLNNNSLINDEIYSGIHPQLFNQPYFNNLENELANLNKSTNHEIYFNTNPQDFSQSKQKMFEKMNENSLKNEIEI